jgi:hypothetical protein
MFTINKPLFTLKALLPLASLLLFFASNTRADIWISEFCADNTGDLLTADGEEADWIELQNSGPSAVDIGGWHLTDNASARTKWSFPLGTTLASNGFLIVFADGASVAQTNGELHANFSLSKEGEYLGLFLPGGETVVDAYSPGFPAQFEGLSYGRITRDIELVGVGTPMRYRIPNAEGSEPWINGTGSLGFCSVSNTAFTIKYYEMTASMGNIDVAEAKVANSANWKTDRVYPVTTNALLIDYHEVNAAGFFATNTLFPEHTAGQDKSNFALVAEASIYIPEAGQWTFCVASDDGFRLRIAGQGVTFVSEFPTARGIASTLATFAFPVAGVYSLSLVYFENGGGAGVELSAAQGYQETFSTPTFKLVGDPAGGILQASSFGSFIETNVEAVMRNINSRVDAEWAFTVENAPVAGDAFTLYLHYLDGVVASINGTVIGERHVPVPLEWNSVATAQQPATNALVWVAYDVPAACLVPGTNILSVTVLNDALSDHELFLQPRLLWQPSTRFPGYFKTSTPRAANELNYTAPTPAVTSSELRGYKTAPFDVTLSCPSAPEATIRYTLNGSVPTTNSPVYTSPLTVTNSTLLRAAVVDPNTARQQVHTVSWFFLEDILKQGTATPPEWPANLAVNSHKMEYGMRTDIVANDGVRLRNGMTNSIPSLSIVTDLSNLFSPTTGIYVNPANDGIAWERPVSVELIDPVRGSTHEFCIDAGLRIRGAASRSPTNPKHSFRLFFRSEYGESKLRFPLFDNEGASEFDKVDLRTSQNYSWAFQSDNKETFIRETFSRDSQRDMGMPYTRSRYYHLYLNGQYWGLYQTQERSEANFGETYLGGKSDDWDCIKTTQPGYNTTAADGTFDAFHAFHNLAILQGVSGANSNNYWRVRGLNPDGSPNPNYPAYLDVDNLIVYMLIAYYVGDSDSPVSTFMNPNRPNNMYALFNRINPVGFSWYRHDAEHSLGARAGYGVTFDGTALGATLTTQVDFNPATLHLSLCQHPDYRTRVGDLIYRHLQGNGALTPTNAQLRFLSRMKELDLAIIGESARWGRGRTRDATWLPACNTVLTQYLPFRCDNVVSQFVSRGWYPSLGAPRCNTNNATVPLAFAASLLASNVFYYTTDGSDPRLPGGGINPQATRISQTNQLLISSRSPWRYFDSGSAPTNIAGRSWIAFDYSDATWPSGSATLGFAGTAPTTPVSTRTKRYVNGINGTQVTTTYFRNSFTLTSTNGMNLLNVSLMRDDGAIIYLNGTELYRENMPTGTVDYATFASVTAGNADQTNIFTRSIGVTNLFRVGTNTIAAEVHQSNAGSSDLYFNLAMNITPEAGATYTAFSIFTNTTIRARCFDGATWSPLEESFLTTYRPPPDYSTLRITELMYAPPGGDAYAWLELRNNGLSPLDLTGIRFANGITHTFAALDLAPHARLVLAKNPATFATRHSTSNMTLMAWTSGNLSRSGEKLSLVTPASSNILTFTYSASWYPETVDSGYSLVAVDLSAPEPQWSTPQQWRPSCNHFGSPGTLDSPLFTSASITPERFMVLSTRGLEGTIELWFSEDLNSWAPCDANAWSREGDTLTIDLQHPSLPGTRCGFFQIRMQD